MAESILVVDDEMDTRETMAMFLLRQGYEVQTAPNGKMGWEFLQSQSGGFISAGCDDAGDERL